MTPSSLLTDALDRTAENAAAAVDGLGKEELAWRPGPDANPIGWLVWHLARVQDDHVADVADHEQVWTAQGHADRFALPLDHGDTGYGHSSEQVASVRVSAGPLLAYLRAVHAGTTTWLASVAPRDLDRVVDERWDPPVTLGVRLVSVADDGAQHAGQAAYVRGLLGR